MICWQCGKTIWAAEGEPCICSCQNKSQATKRTRQINDRGIGYAGIDKELIRDIRVYDEGDRVQVWVEVMARGSSGETTEAMQYLTAQEAMAFAKAFERCAIQALKEAA